MKKIFTIAFLLATVTLSGQGFSFDEIKVKPKAAFQYFPARNFIYVEDRNFELGRFRTKKAIDFTWEFVTLSFESQVLMNKNTTWFKPVRADFYATLNLKVTDNLSFKIEHLCIHPVYSTARELQMIGGGYDLLIGVSWGY